MGNYDNVEMVMKQVCTFYRNYSDIVQWLQENVGPLLHSKPLIFWHGQGWHMRDYRKTDFGNPVNNQKGWSIEFTDDVKDSIILLFQIRFG